MFFYCVLFQFFFFWYYISLFFWLVKSFSEKNQKCFPVIQPFSGEYATALRQCTYCKSEGQHVNTQPKHTEVENTVIFYLPLRCLSFYTVEHSPESIWCIGLFVSFSCLFLMESYSLWPGTYFKIHPCWYVWLQSVYCHCFMISFKNITYCLSTPLLIVIWNLLILKIFQWVF